MLEPLSLGAMELQLLINFIGKLCGDLSLEYAIYFVIFAATNYFVDSFATCLMNGNNPNSESISLNAGEPYKKNI